MPETITIELKSDLERICRITRDILDAIDSGNIRCESLESERTTEWIRFGLMDIEGTLQKDIFNCGHLMNRFRVMPAGMEENEG